MSEVKQEERGHAPIALPANGFELSSLDKALGPVLDLKTDTLREERIGEVIMDQAHDKGTLEAGLSAIAVPEGHKIGQVLNANGDLIYAPVAMTAEELEKQAAKTKQGETAPPPPPPPPSGQAPVDPTGDAKIGANATSNMKP